MTILQKTPVILIICLICFLVPRCIGLGKNWTTDERLWLTRSYEFKQAMKDKDFGKTFQSIHPGVLTMWTISSTMKLMNYRPFSIKKGPRARMYDVNEAKLRILKGGMVVVCCLLFSSIALMLFQLLGKEAGLYAALLIALDPVMAGYNRILHLDAIFVLCGLASLCAALLSKKNGSGLKKSLGSAFFAGLATLNRTQGIFFIVFLCAVIVFTSTRSSLEKMTDKKSLLKALFFELLVVISTYCLLIFLAFPALWVAPIETITEIITGGVSLATSIHPHPNFLFGSIFHDVPNYMNRQFLYWNVLFFRLTPSVQILCVSGLLGLVLYPKKLFHDPSDSRKKMFVFFLLICTYISLVALGQKLSPDGRYILITFPLAAIFSGVWMAELSRKTRQSPKKILRRGGSILPALLIITGFVESIRAMPYPLAYASPLIGGPAGYQRLSCLGWGEGYYEVAKWLKGNNLSSATVATNYRGLDPYHGGEVYSLATFQKKGADIVVLYKCSTLRNFPSCSQNIEARLDQSGIPKHTLKILGAEYFTIYETR